MAKDGTVVWWVVTWWVLDWWTLELILLMDGVFGWNWIVQKNEVLVELFVWWV